MFGRHFQFPFLAQFLDQPVDFGKSRPGYFNQRILFGSPRISLCKSAQFRNGQTLQNFIELILSFGRKYKKAGILVGGRDPGPTANRTCHDALILVLAQGCLCLHKNHRGFGRKIFHDPIQKADGMDISHLSQRTRAARGQDGVGVGDGFEHLQIVEWAYIYNLQGFLVRVFIQLLPGKAGFFSGGIIEKVNGLDG